VKTVRGLWANQGFGKKYHPETEGAGTAKILIVLPRINRSITLKYLWSAAAGQRKLCMIYGRAHMIYEDLTKHQHTADFL
jgi:hypothetical protein